MVNNIDNICLRGCSLPKNMVPQEMTVSSTQKRLEELSKTNLIPPAKASSSLLTSRINMNFCWQVAQVEALFQAVYKQGLVTDQDETKLTELAEAIQEEQREITVLPLSASGLSHAKKCLVESSELLTATFSLVKSLKHYNTIAKDLDESASSIVDRTVCPLISGESLAATRDVVKSVKKLVELQKFVTNLDKNDVASNRLGEMFNNDLEELSIVIEDWEEQLLKDVKYEESFASDAKDEQRLQNALMTKRQDMVKKLKRLAIACRKNPDLKKLGIQLLEITHKIEKTTQHKQPTLSVENLKWGSKEWISLMRKRPKAQQSFIEQLFNRLIHPEQWSERTQHLVHAVLVGMQLSQTVHLPSLDISSTKQTSQQMQEFLKSIPMSAQLTIEQDIFLLGALLSQKDQASSEEPRIQAVLRAISGKVLSRDEIHDILDAYRLHQLIQVLPYKHSGAQLSFNEFLGLYQRDLVAPELGWVPNKIAAIGGCLPTDSNYASLIAQKRNESLALIEEASETLALCERQIPLLERAQEQKDVHYYVELLYKELMKSVEKAPLDTCPLIELAIWAQAVQDKCYAIKTLEEQIAKSMEPLRQATREDDLDRYGNKHKNLILQARLVEALEIPGVVVPVPRGVASDQVEDFLQKQAPKVFTEWEALGKLFESYTGNTFLQEPNVIAHLKAIDRLIADAFDKAGQDDALFQQLVPQDVIAWLHTIKQNGDYLMVRSTGAEDSRQLANAGGNVSRAYVAPEKGPFSAALGDVVRSYFSYSSLQNRINANMNPFTQGLKLAVTAQQLIGEPLGGSTIPEDIPISLVLFTSEPLYVGGERFRTMRISATYGHGEGVVGNQGIASDSALLLISEAHPDELYVLYDNQSKPTRLAPIATEEGVVLGKVENPPEIRDQRVLSPELLTRLYQWGVVAEKYFDDHPTDIELVIKKNIIYSVQARDINRPDTLPTYLDLKKIAVLPNSPITEKIQADMIVPGRASVVTITQANEIHYATTLEEAQNTFIKGQHKLVVVSTSEPVNSHPVVNFSSLGIPCLLVDDLESIKALQKKITAQTPLITCVQSTTLNLWDASNAVPNDYISKGCVVHPAKIAISLNVVSERPTDIPSEVPQEVKDLAIAIRSATTREVAQKHLQVLRSHKWVTNIKERKKEFKNSLKTMRSIPKKVRQTVIVLQELDDKIDKAFSELEHAFQNMQETDRLRPLFHAKVLETLLFSRPSGNSLSQYSLLDVEPLHADAMAIINYQKELSHKPHFTSLLFAGKNSFDPSFESEWRSFLIELESLAEDGKVSKQEIQQFKHLIHTLKNTGLLTTAITFFMPSVTTSIDLHSEDLLNALKAILQILPKTDETIVRHMQGVYKKMKEMGGQLNRFGEKKSIDQAFADLQRESKVLDSSSIKDVFQSGSFLTRLLILQNMNALTEVYDTAIKTMKSSQQFTEQEKTKLFKQMLYPYLDLLQDWSRNVVNKDNIPTHDDWNVETYLDKLNELIKAYPETEDQLYPSQDFSVVAAILGTLTDFKRHYPKHLEDMFTLIHQNLVSMISRENQGIISSERIINSHLPKEFQVALSHINPHTLRQAIQQTGIPHTRGQAIQQTGIYLTEKEITVNYNVPLQNHSAQLQLTYDKETKNIVMTGFFLGQARDRWDGIIALADFLDKTSLLPLAGPLKLGSLEAVIPWKIDSFQQLVTAFREFGIYCGLSFTTFYADNEINLLLTRFETELQNKDIMQIFINYIEIPTIFDRQLSFRKGLVSALVQKDFLRNQEIPFITKLISHNSPEICRVGVQLASILLNENQGSAEFISIIKKLIEDPNSQLQIEVTDLAIELISKFPETATEMAIFVPKLISNENSEVRKSGLKLARALVDRKLGIKEAITAALKCIIDYKTQQSATLLLSKLHKIPEVRSELISLIPQLTSNEDPEIEKCGLELAKLLIIWGSGIEEGLVAAQKYIKEDVRVDILQIGINLAIQLIDQGHEVPGILNDVQKLTSNKDRIISALGLMLATALVKNNQLKEEMVIILQHGISRSHKVVDRMYLTEIYSLAFALVSRGYGIDESIFLMLKFTSIDSNFFRPIQGFQLASKLLDRDHAIEQVIVLIKPFITNNDVFEDGKFEIVKKLLSKGYLIQEIVGLVERVYSNLSVEEEVYQLAALLADVGESVELVSKIIINLVKVGLFYHVEDLIMKLLSTKKGISQVIIVIPELISSERIRDRRLGLGVISHLLDRGDLLDRGVEMESVLLALKKMTEMDISDDEKIRPLELIKKITDLGNVIQPSE